MGGKGSGRRPAAAKAKAAPAATEESQPKIEIQTTPQEQVGDEILTGGDRPSVDMPPLFSEETPPTEAELMGEEDESPEETETSETSAEEETSGEEETAETPEPEGEETPVESEEETEEAAPEKGEEEPESEGPEETPTPEKPPRGYVPHAALHEARQQNKELRSDLNQALERIAQLETKGTAPPPEPTGEFKDFKVLSDQEFEELADDDPTEAVKYQAKLRRYEAQEAKKARDLESARKAQDQAERVVRGTVERITKSVPGIYDEDKDIAATLTRFAEENGFDTDYLGLMTNPGTYVIPVGQEQPVLLADGAACLVELIHKFNQMNSDPEIQRAEIEAAYDKKMRKEIEKELLEKFKKGPSGVPRRSITQISGGEETPKAGFKDLSEREYAKLSPEEQRRYLSGE